jgi:hypothetical protein
MKNRAAPRKGRERIIIFDRDLKKNPLGLAIS